MKTFRLIGAGLLAIILCFTFSSCSDDDDEDGGGNNPFVGVWREGNNKIEYKSNGTFITTYNYFLNDDIFTKKGTYGYDEATRTLTITRDTGISYIHIVLNISKNRITYSYSGHLYDPEYTYTLERI